MKKRLDLSRRSIEAEGKKFERLQDVTAEGAILILLRLRDMFLSATNFVGLSMCSSLVTVGFSTSQQ